MQATVLSEVPFRVALMHQSGLLRNVRIMTFRFQIYWFSLHQS